MAISLTEEQRRPFPSDKVSSGGMGRGYYLEQMGYPPDKPQVFTTCDTSTGVEYLVTNQANWFGVQIVDNPANVYNLDTPFKYPGVTVNYDKATQGGEGFVDVVTTLGKAPDPRIDYAGIIIEAFIHIQRQAPKCNNINFIMQADAPEKARNEILSMAIEIFEDFGLTEVACESHPLASEEAVTHEPELLQAHHWLENSAPAIFKSLVREVQTHN